MHVIAASFATYDFKRRLVYKVHVSKELWPRRGIIAGSRFATGDLLLVYSDLMHQVFEVFPSVAFGIHADDLSYSAKHGDPDQAVSIKGYRMACAMKLNLD